MFRYRHHSFLILLPVFFVIAACGLSQQGPEEVPLTILYSGNVNGELERCGCAEKQLGGVARRKTVIEKHFNENTLLLDTGDVFFGSFHDLVGSREFYRSKGSAMVRSMNRMGYDAVMIGDYDFAQGNAFIDEKFKEASFSFVCANLVDSNGKNVVDPYRIVMRGGLRVALVGFLDSNVVTTPYRKALGNWVIKDPFQTAAEILPEIQKRSDLIVSLIHFNIIETGDFLKTFPQIHVALLGHSKGNGIPERIAQTVTVAGGDLGKELGRLNLTVLSGKGILEYSGALIPVSQDVSPDAKVEEEVAQFNKTVREKRFSEEVSFLSETAEDAQYIGADRCAVCHPVIFQRWSLTSHAFAFETLKERKYEYNPECVVCHVVGYRNPDGFTGHEKTPYLAGVQCESCHGPGQAHLLGNPVKSGVPEEVCRRCHNEVHSPHFDAPLYFQHADQCTLS